MALQALRSPSQFSSSTELHGNSSGIFGSKPKFSENRQTQLKAMNSAVWETYSFKITETRQSFKIEPEISMKNKDLVLKASRDSPGLAQELTINKENCSEQTKNKTDLFDEIKTRFHSFKKRNYQENMECYQNLAKGQSPKFLVISCADSRVCPSNILGFQPGDAFIVRNVANLVPPFESGPFETKAALEFSVTSLEVPNILVIGHSCCGGIRALMGIQDEVASRSFIKDWVIVGNNARLTTKAVASNLSFDQQCRHCEKESINRSLWNLLTYPWIEEKVKKGELSIHGGYYDFIDCTFEKWSLDHQVNGSFALKNREFWS